MRDGHPLPNMSSPILPSSPSPMADHRPSDVCSSTNCQPMTPMHPVHASGSLVKPSRRHRRNNPRARLGRLFRSISRTLPIFTTPKCKIPNAPCKLALPARPDDVIASVIAGGRRSLQAGTRISGTLFGYRKGRVSLSVQETPQCIPSLIVELAIPTHVLMRDMSSGMVRIALECEKLPEHKPGRLLDEPLWTMFCNGKKSGYGVKREMSEDDLSVMEVLKPVSMGAGVLPGRSETEGPDGEMAYMRANFEHVVGSRDSETLYMLGPDMGANGPELTIFFIRI